MSAKCLSCDAENTRDYPMCPTHETKCHLTNRQDCRCAACQTKRAEAARIERAEWAEAAWIEEGQYVHGYLIGAAV